MTLDDLAKAADIALTVEMEKAEGGLLFDTMSFVRTILTTIEQAGYKIVPVEATEEMTEANVNDGFGPVNIAGPYHAYGSEFYLNLPQLERIYTAMISASPKIGEE